MHGYLSLDIICSSKLTVFLELRSLKTVRFSEQIMSADKYPCIFSRQMKTNVYKSVADKKEKSSMKRAIDLDMVKVTGFCEDVNAGPGC